MNELSAILECWRGLGKNTQEAVLASVVHVHGSAYRRPGARMLILGDGSRIGTISGGCLESNVVRKAWWWTDGGPTVRSFDNTTEDAAWDFGLGCNGVVTVLLERLSAPNARKLLLFLDDYQAKREAVVIATIVGSETSTNRIGDRILYNAHGIVEENVFFPADLLSDAVSTTFSERKSRLVHLGEMDVFVEWVGPPQRLFIFGAGHDTMPLATIARMMGWRVIIADHRPSYLQPRRFPSAERIFPIPFSGDISNLDINSDDVVVLMTHNYPQDLLLLPQVLSANPRYLGILGPRSRTERLFAEIGANPYLENIYGPTGLDIGGAYPEAIALSIASEIQSVLSGRTGGLLRQRMTAIHNPALEFALRMPDSTWSAEHGIQSTCTIDYA